MKFEELEFDLEKDASNYAKHKLRLSDFKKFDGVPLVIADRRQDYGEDRFQAFGRIEGRGHMIVFVLRNASVQLISFRRVREQDMRRYEDR